jgi:hypothetical protein
MCGHHRDDEKAMRVTAETRRKREGDKNGLERRNISVEMSRNVVTERRAVVGGG